MTIATTSTGPAPVGESTRTRDGRLDPLRLLSALPPAVGSFLLLVLVLGWMGSLEAIALAAWFAGSVLVATRAGERVAVTVMLGFRSPTRAQTEALATIWATVLRRAERSNVDFDLYVRRSAEPNAFAVGARSVAVTTGLLREFAARRLTEEQMQALLLHELGHHGTGGTQGGLSVAWLALPWRVASRLLVQLSALAGRRTQSLRSLMVVVVAAVVVAVVQAVHQQHWAAAFVLCAVSLCAIVCPVADAALGRRGEYAADGYASALGYGPQLGIALRTLGDEDQDRLSLVARVLSRHPSTSVRVRALRCGRSRA